MDNLYTHPCPDCGVYAGTDRIVVACGWIANAYGCKVDEGSVHPCIIGGVDRGELLYSMGVLGWLMLVTLPVGGLAFLVWLAILIAHRLRWKNRTPQTG